MATHYLDFEKPIADLEAKIEELSAQGKTMVIVSHDQEMVRQICGRGIVIRQGQQVYDGPINEALEAMMA